MGYVYLLCIAVMFSFGGTCVRLIRPYFAAQYITFFRFAVGVGFLLLLKLVKRQHFPNNFKSLLKAMWFWILLFGFITGFGFYLNAKAIPMVPFYMVPIIQSTMAIWAILWGVLFFHERISAYIVVGTLMFMAGLAGMQWKGKKT